MGFFQYCARLFSFISAMRSIAGFLSFPRAFLSFLKKEKAEGQIGLETIAGIIIFLGILLLSAVFALNGNSMVRDIDSVLRLEAECLKLSAVSSAVYASGPGAAYSDSSFDKNAFFDANAILLNDANTKFTEGTGCQHFLNMRDMNANPSIGIKIENSLGSVVIGNA